MIASDLQTDYWRQVFDTFVKQKKSWQYELRGGSSPLRTI